ncbi:MAG: lysophospholipid transporter LplT [Aquabacterium sp.]|uniref:lysophospholipid transporter LplT n=1 Tax=Aquabacterium sp. TaxID=1872578 RepID=UPI0025BB5543|nr:lysophospholipid transporter LplT [Aquabacterium sp.]MBI3380871.1 lysophospholipid transporter LplT [Aquabacterium sp.]
MKKGFFTIMAAQFFSSLADNALLVGAIELLKTNNAPAWQMPFLAPMFALFYVVLAPFVGAFADALPKGKVMFLSNSIKVIGCLLMLFGLHPLLAYAVVGLGAAAYSPAKYGILTELLPPSQLVKANGWIEGLTVASIILGVLLGGQLVGVKLSSILLGFDFPVIDTGVTQPWQAAVSSMIVLYMIAALFNLRIPRTDAVLQPMSGNLMELLRDFWQCNSRLWKDKLGQISLASTTLVWGVSGNMRVIVFPWAAAALGYSTTQASSLAGVVVLGTAVSAVVASVSMRLDLATKLIPLGVLMGVLMLGLNVITSLTMAVPFLILLGATVGYLVVPMNALLQHRGHNLMGAGRSIAVQNFNEQACILALGGLYAGATSMGLSAFGAITVFGLVVASVMGLVGLWHRRNTIVYKAEVDQLMALARSDGHHH